MNLNIRIRRAHILVLAALLSVFVLAACGAESGSKIEANITDKALKWFNDHQPIPFFKYSAIRSHLIQIETHLAKDEDTWTVIISNNMFVDPYVCPSKGFPIPATTQLTSPDKKVGGDNDTTTIAQMDPTGVYPPPQTEGTYILCVQTVGPDKGTTGLVYSEPGAITFPYAVRIVEKANGHFTIVPVEDSPVTVKIEEDPRSDDVVGTAPSS